jgi:exopolysaccharide production protein ExoQ
MPTLALLSGLAFVGWMFSRDRRWRQLPSTALWIPGIWLAISSSRPLSFWFEQLGFGGGGSSSLEGRPINVVINTSLFLLALLVLSRRRFSWVQWTLSNKALFSIYAFFLCSMLWSAFPLPTLKRLIQDFGSVLIALIVLTESDPSAALRVIFVRVSYILFPLSVVFIRYFPNIGRQVSGVSGTHILSGVADHKNALGQLAMVFCLVLIFDLMQTWDSQRADGKQPERWIRFANLGIGLYLLVISASATALLCFVTGVTLLFLSTRLAGMKNGRIVFMLGVLTMVALIATQQSSSISEALGRGSGLSGRTEIWRATLAKNTNYWFGAGFRGFWETPEGMSVAQELSTNQLLTAHNGYIEVYLHGGVAALCLLGVWIWSMGLKATAKLVDGEPIGTLAVVFWPLFLIYNVTESQFFQMGSIWFGILLVTMGTPWLHRREAPARMRMGRHEWQRGQGRGGSAAPVGGAAFQGTMKPRFRN